MTQTFKMISSNTDRENNDKIFIPLSPKQLLLLIDELKKDIEKYGPDSKIEDAIKVMEKAVGEWEDMICIPKK